MTDHSDARDPGTGASATEADESVVPPETDSDLPFDAAVKLGEFDSPL